MQLRIRRLNEADLDQIMVIEPQAFGTHHWSRQSFINELTNPSGFYFAIIDDLSGRLCGYSGFWLIGEEAHITTLAVHPDLRRQYVGELLLINDIEHAQQVGASWLTLEVRVSNYPAQNLYFKYGFKNLGTRRKYYQDNDEDALVLWAEQICSDEFKKNVNARLADLQGKMAVSNKGFISGALPGNSQNT
jgi:[ribosomal protein S18]-alanine N-acetyltransferase